MKSCESDDAEQLHTVLYCKPFVLYCLSLVEHPVYIVNSTTITLYQANDCAYFPPLVVVDLLTPKNICDIANI